MNVRGLLKYSKTIVGLVHDLRKSAIPLQCMMRCPKIRRYLMSHQVRKLQLGAGPDTIAGWLGTDIYPRSSRAIYLDATKRFPFPDDTFDYICCEHMIEHISWQQGQFMLRECRRVIKPGGRMRIATPDLTFLVGLYVHSNNMVNNRFIHWFVETFPRGIPGYNPAIVLNTSLGGYWGHQLIYDGTLLETAMHEAGFVDIQRYAPGQSSDKNLSGLEMHRKKCGDYDIAVLETMVYECTCPPCKKDVPIETALERPHCKTKVRSEYIRSNCLSSGVPTHQL